MTITTPILDDFDRPDESPLGGGFWSGGVRYARDMDLESFEARDDNSGGNICDSRWIGTFGAGDLEVYATVSTLTTATSSRMYLWCRVLQPGVTTVDCYLCLLKGNSGSNQTIEVYRLDNGSFTKLGATLTTAVSSGGIIGIRHNDAGGSNNIEVDLNGTTVMTRTDNTHTGTAEIGLGIRNAGTRLADFGGGLVTGGVSVTLLQMQNHLRFSNNSFA